MLRPAGLPFRTFLAFVLGFLLVGAADATTWTVCSSGCDYTSIQDAVDDASEGDTLELGPETFYEHVVAYQKALTIRGAGPERTVVDGGGSGIVFHIRLRQPGALLADMTIRNGTTGVEAPMIEIDNCIIRDNTDTGVVVGARGTINDSNITQNTGTRGGGVRFFDGAASFGSLTISGSIISGNSADEFGGGVWASQNRLGSPELFIHSTLIAGNSAGRDGGGVFCEDCSALISNSTVTGNTADHEGGGVYVSEAALTIIESTITGNDGDGLGAGRYWETVLEGSIVAGNNPVNCDYWYAYPTSAGYNISDDASCGLNGPGDMENTDPLLGPLADNGGPTPTHALAPGSPAIDAGGDACEPTDQRGVVRPQDGDGDGEARCDIGAFELAPFQVQIDIKPGGFPNSINPRSRGVIPAAILGSAEFDVVDVDVSTLRFGPSEAVPTHSGHLQDVNYDAIMDLVVHFRTQETGIQSGDTEATLTGQLLSGQPIEGTDSIITVGCPRIDPRPVSNAQRERRDNQVSLFDTVERD